MYLYLWLMTQLLWYSHYSWVLFYLSQRTLIWMRLYKCVWKSMLPWKTLAQVQYSFDLRMLKFNQWYSFSFLQLWWNGFKQMVRGSLWNTRSCNCLESLLRHEYEFQLIYNIVLSVSLHVFTGTFLQTLYSFSAHSSFFWHFPATLLYSHRGFINQFP